MWGMLGVAQAFFVTGTSVTTALLWDPFPRLSTRIGLTIHLADDVVAVLRRGHRRSLVSGYYYHSVPT